MGWDAGLTGSGKPISQVRASGKVSYSVLPKRPLCGGLTNDNPAAINPANFRAGSVLGREPEARGYARPGTDKQVRDGDEDMSDISERVKKIVVEHLGVEADKVTDNACFIDDLGADSLDTVELVYTSPSPRDGLLSRMPSS